MKQKLLITAITTIILSTSTAAIAGGGGVTAVTNATEITQLANNSELTAIYAEEIEQVTNQLEQISNQLKMYNDMIQQATALPTSYLNDVTSQLTALKKAVTQTVGLYESYGQMAESLQKMWDTELSGNALDNALTRAKQSKATLNAIASKIDNTVSQIEKDNDVIETILDRSANAVGRMQAIQAGTEMAAATAQEVNKLRDDVSALNAIALNTEVERQLAKEESLAAQEEIMAGLEAGVKKPSFSTIFDK